MLESLDRALFFIINDDLSNSFFDWIMPLLRNKMTWIPLYALILVLLVKKYKKKVWLSILACLICIGLSDQISSQLIKKSVERYRPCNNSEIKEQVHLRVGHCSGGYSFTSSHATNHFALAMVFAFLLAGRRRWVWVGFVLWAVSIAFAQVYVGVHHPSDVFAGALLGVLIGSLVCATSSRFLEKTSPGRVKNE